MIRGYSYIHTRLTILLFTALCANAVADDELDFDEIRRRPLIGVKGVIVLVTSDEEYQTAGFTKDKLRTRFELQLRKAGVRVVPIKEGDPESAVLSISLDAVAHTEGLTAMHTQLKLRQMVTLTHDPSITVPAITWHDTNLGIGGPNTFRSSVEGCDDLVAKFANDYLAANAR